MLRTTAVLLSCAATLGAQVSLTHLATVDVASTSNSANPEYIGTNPSAVAWNGTDLWIAGFNNTNAGGTTAIVRIANALANPTAPTYGVPFGVYAATPSQRGYSGLDVRTGQLAAALDTGASIPEGITAWDLGGNLLWTKDARGSSGVGFDPGFFQTVDSGTGWTTFGSGRRALQDNTTGADIYDLSNGMIVNAGSGTLWRDMDFDPVSGDVWLRKANELVYCQRVGGNSVAGNQVVAGGTFAPFVNQHNLAFVGQPHERVVFWNERASATNGQLFTTSIRCTRTSDGADLPIDFGAWSATAFAITGSGAYDFGYDDASRTLAISDFGNRAVYVFAVSLYHEYGTGCQGVGGFTPRLAASGDSRANGAITYDLTGAAPSSIGAFVFGHFQDNTPLPFPGACPQHVTPLVFSAGLFSTAAGNPGTGVGSYVLFVPTGLAGIPVTTQVAVLENVSLSGLRTSNAIEIVLP